jgi:FkbM family methyltransferase
VNKVTEPYWAAWLLWHLYRKRRGERYRRFFAFRTFVRSLPRGGLMIDCGANVGDVTRLFLQKGYTVHAFEPDPAARAVLDERFGAAPGLHVHPQAVSDRPGRLTLHRAAGVSAGDPKRTISSSLVARDIHDGGAGVAVEVIDLLAFMDGLGRRVDVLKLDIEGAEVEILEAMLDRRYDRRIGHVLVETHERFSPDIAARLAAIRRRVAELGIGNVNLDWT